jgi:two-component system, cell cycle response regulator
MAKPTVLVVDDELFFRRLYTEILEEDDLDVEAVDSGDAALARLHKGGIDLVVSDMIMPGLDGLEVLRQVRQFDNPPDLILATGHATLDTAIQALKNGARDYLIKPFNPEELKHLARTCLEQRRLLNENSLLKSQIRLFQKGQNLASLLDIDRLIVQAVTAILQEAGAGRGLTLLLNKNELDRVAALHGFEESAGIRLAKEMLPIIQGLTGIRILREADLQELVDLEMNLKTVCLFPLRCQKALKGAIVIVNPVDTDFGSEMTFENMMFLAEQGAIGFDNAYRYKGARELIYSDDLTGLFNQRYLDIVLEQEIRRAERYGLEFSILFLDLDLFKNVNDVHGHIAGSNALKEVAKILRKCIREVDVPFRYGGDEFTAMLVETGVEGAAVVAERVRRDIENHVFLKKYNQNSRLTASVGYATFPLHATDKKTILDLADKAMYFGKKVRNIACCAGDLKPS